MKKNVKNISYIDGANLHNSVKANYKNFDYAKFRIYLKEKLSVEVAYIFLGMVQGNQSLYKYLSESGYVIVFKETITNKNKEIKGNCDADIVLNLVRDLYENKYDGAILVSSDGDFSSTVEFLKSKNKFKLLISPYENCSFLLRKLNIKITYIKDILTLVEKEKTPNEDGTSQGFLSLE